MNTDLVMQSDTPAVLSRAKRKLGEALAITPVHQISSHGAKRRRLVRIHAQLSRNSESRENLSEVVSVLMHEFSIIASVLKSSPGMVSYILVSAPCGSDDKFARSVVFDSDLMAVCIALRCAIVVSVYPIT